MPTRFNRGFYCRSYCLLNMFRTPLCPSSGAQEYYTAVAACGISCCGFQVAGLVWSWGWNEWVIWDAWYLLFFMDDCLVCGVEWMQFHSTLHTRQSSIQNNKYQVSYKHSCYSWWWAYSRPKHVETDKYTKKNCAPSCLYLQDYTGMHGQQNIKLVIDPIGNFVTINLGNS